MTLLARRRWHGGHGGRGIFDWWTVGLVILVVVVVILLVIRARRRSARFGQDTDGSWPDAGTAPGWYPDPNDMGLMRYHDGQGWTSQTRPRE